MNQAPDTELTGRTDYYRQTQQLQLAVSQVGLDHNIGMDCV